MDGVSGKAYSTSITEDMAGKTSLEIDHEGLECLIRFSLSFQKNLFFLASEGSGVACLACSSGRVARGKVSILNAF